MNMRQNYILSYFIISHLNTYMFYQIKRTALLGFISLIDVSISIGTVEQKAYIKDEKLLFSCRSLVHNHSSKSVTHKHHRTLGLILWNTFPAFNAADSNCCLFWGVSVFTLLFIWWNLIRFKSGDWLGQSKTFHFFALINSLTELAGVMGHCSDAICSTSQLIRWLYVEYW